MFVIIHTSLVLDTSHGKRARVAGCMVAAVHGAEHRGCAEVVRLSQFGPPPGHGIPDDSFIALLQAPKKNTAMAAVVHESALQFGNGTAGAELFCGDEALEVAGHPALQEAQDRSCSMQGEVAASERVAGEEAAPRFVSEGGADEDLWLLRRNAEQDLFHELLHHAPC